MVDPFSEQAFGRLGFLEGFLFTIFHIPAPSASTSSCRLVLAIEMSESRHDKVGMKVLQYIKIHTV